MTPGDFDLLQKTFTTLVGLGEIEREAYCRKFGKEHPRLAPQLKLLLKADGLTDERIERSLSVVLNQSSRLTNIDFDGRRLGPWRVEGELAQGGMSRVFFVERDDDAYHLRAVAKIMGVQISGDEAERRFRQETQLLANFSHPAIARLLDAGTTTEGLPYLIMEWVDGQPVDQFCEARSLAIADRIRLFLKICDAVDYAHRNLVVHSDLKPGNILVEADGSPKLLDFGIARQMTELGDTALKEKSRAFTPAYAAPEQVRGDAPTIAADIYALGTLLFRLLTNALPYRDDIDDLKRLSRAVLNGETLAPSALKPGLHKDIDAIVGRCMQLDPADRYRDVRALSDDLRSHLRGDPVSVRRSEPGYVLSKFLIRRKLVLTTGVIAAVIGTGLTVKYISDINRARLTAEQARTNAENSTDFLVSMFSKTDPQVSQGTPITAERLLDMATQELDMRELDADARAQLMITIARSYTNLGDPEKAVPLLTSAAEILGPDADHTLKTRLSMALSEALRLSGDVERAEQVTRDVISTLLPTRASDEGVRIDALTRLGVILFDQRTRNDEAAAVLNEVISLKQAKNAPPDSDFVDALGNLGIVYDRMQDYERAEDLLRRAVDLSIEIDGPLHPNTVIRTTNLGLMLVRAGKYESAEAALRVASEKADQVWDKDHPQTVFTLRAFASALRRMGRLDESLEVYVDACDRVARREGTGSMALAACHGGLAAVYVERQEYDQADALLNKALSTAASHGESGNFQSGVLRVILARSLLAQGQADDALRVLTEAQSYVSYLNGSQRFELGLNLAEALSRSGEADRASALLTELRADAGTPQQQSDLDDQIKAHADRSSGQPD